jgi:hypothetical protein
MQAVSAAEAQGVVQTTKNVVARGGVKSLFNGLGAMVLGAGMFETPYLGNMFPSRKWPFFPTWSVEREF